MNVKTSFGKFAKIWDAQVGDANNIVSAQVTSKAVMKLLGKVKGKRIYEIACGNGFLARSLVKAGSKEMWASDVSPELITIAQTKYNAKGINYFVREGTDFRKLPKNYFDSVIIHQGIFYIENLDALFRGIQKILKPGGSLMYTIGHPLSSAFIEAVNTDTTTKERADIIAIAKKYPTQYTLKMNKKWKMNGEPIAVQYWAYKRPLCVYVNIAAKYGLFVSHIIEPRSATKIKGVLKKSSIPSSFVIKTVKI